MRHLIVVSDLHVNSHLGLWHPDFNDDGGQKGLNKFQKTLWKWWGGFCYKVERLKGYKILVLNGDIVQGIHPKRDTELRTLDPAIQNEAASAVVMELSKYAD